MVNIFVLIADIVLCMPLTGTHEDNDAIGDANWGDIIYSNLKDFWEKDMYHGLMDFNFCIIIHVLNKKHQHILFKV